MDNPPNNNNDNSWLPSKEDVALVNYAVKKAHLRKNKLGIRLAVDIHSIEQGTCCVPTKYIRVMAYCMRKLVPRKMNISKLSLSEREEINKLMNGKVNTISAYKEILLTLGRMPDLPPKHPQNKKENLPWWWGDPHAIPYYNHTSYQKSVFNSNFDFEYGIADT